MPFSPKLLQMGAAGAGEKLYIEDVFSTYLYTGNGSTQTITNNIDLSTKGGLVWTKSRNTTWNNALVDTVRGGGAWLNANDTAAEGTGTYLSFNSDGYLVNNSFNNWNGNTNTYVSWTFAQQEKFFDVVTYTGNGTARTISHNLGSVPGCIIVKRTDTTGDWQVYHRSLANTEYLVLNSTAAKATGTTRWNSTTPTSTVFSLGTDTTVNANGGTYVAYLFAHDAGGFGASGSDNVITCGSYVGNGSSTGPTITLGYEPQWVLIKQATDAGTRWTITDNMRGFPVTTSSGQQILQPNNNEAEVGVMYIQPTSTGFKVVDVDADVNTNGKTYIYIAIRRGPMKTPTNGTSVFTPITATASTGTSRTVGFVSDLAISSIRTLADTGFVADRLRGFPNSSTGTSPLLRTVSTNAESSAPGNNIVYNVWNTTALDGPYQNTYSNVWWHFGRAPGFFDVVCYTGDGSATSRSITHSLGVKPEFVIVKRRGSTGYWAAGHGTSGLLFNINSNAAGTSQTNTATSQDGYVWIDDGTTTTFKVINGDTSGNAVNASSSTYVAYLFASLTGVSKVFSYTGNGSSQTINCGFTAGARFILIKRTDSTGDWYVYDSARGIVSGNDPQLKLNSAAAEATGYDAIDPDNSGFIVNNDATNFPINVNNATYIGLAIA